MLHQLTDGLYKSVIPKKLDIYNVLFAGEADFVWLFKNIEVVEAKLKGIELNLFDPEEAGIPYGPCTLLISHREFLSDYSFLVQKFFEVTNKAYIEVTENPTKTTEILCLRGAEFFPDKELLLETIVASCEYYLTPRHTWGAMNEERWLSYLNWLEEKNEIKKAHFNPALLYNNDFLKNSIAKS